MKLISAGVPGDFNPLEQLSAGVPRDLSPGKLMLTGVPGNLIPLKLISAGVSRDVSPLKLITWSTGPGEEFRENSRPLKSERVPANSLGVISGGCPSGLIAPDSLDVGVPRTLRKVGGRENPSWKFCDSSALAWGMYGLYARLGEELAAREVSPRPFREVGDRQNPSWKFCESSASACGMYGF